jgi:hypothetical protein
VAWKLAVGADLALPEVEGHRPLSMRITNGYVDRLQAAAESDVIVAEQFTKVIALVDPPARLLHPRMMFRVAAGNRRSRKASSLRLPRADADHATREAAATSHFQRVQVVVGVAAGRPLVWHVADAESVRRRRAAVKE